MFKVLISTADKASPNQRFVSMSGANFTYNLFAPERKLFFISDPPHIMKTVRNNIANSGSGLRSRYLWVSKFHATKFNDYHLTTFFPFIAKGGGQIVFDSTN